MSQVSIVDIEHNNPQIPTRFNANVGFAIPIANTLEIYGATVPAGVIPVYTTGSGNNITTNVQRSQAIAASDATRVGLAAFDSASFGVDANGFVTFTGSSFEGLTPDDGAQVVPVAGNINVFGQKALVAPVMETHNIGGNFLIENRSWESQYVVDPSAVIGLQGTFQTIQAALDQAVADGMLYTSPRKIIIRTGTYAENLTIPGGAFFEAAGYMSDPQAAIPFVTIAGNHTLADICEWASNGIQWQTPSGDMFTSGGVFALCLARNSVFYNSGSGQILQGATGTTILDWYDCQFLSGGTPFASVINVGSLNSNSVRDCVFNGCGFTLGGGALKIENCKDIGTITLANAQVFAVDCNFGANSTANISGTSSSSRFYNCGFTNNDPSQYAIDISGTAYLINCYLPSNISIPRDFISPTTAYGSGFLTFGNVLKAVRVDVDYASVGGENYIGVTDTSAPRAIQIRRGQGSTTSLIDYQVFVVDESGAASVNNITVTDVDGALINGAASYVIDQNFGDALFHTDGTNWFVTSASNQVNSITYTPDSGGVIAPAGTLNVLGAEYGASLSKIMETHNVTGNLILEPRAYETPYVVDASSTVGMQGTYTTVQAALNAAVADGMAFNNFKKITLRAGTYTENLTIPPGAILEGAAHLSFPTGGAITPLNSTTIVGNHTLSGNSITGFNNLNMISTSGDIFSDGTAAIILIYFNNCFLAALDGSHIITTSLSSGYYSFIESTFAGVGDSEAFSIVGGGGKIYLNGCKFEQPLNLSLDATDFICVNTTGIGYTNLTTGSSIDAVCCTFDLGATRNYNIDASVSGNPGNLKSCYFYGGPSIASISAASTGNTWFIQNCGTGRPSGLDAHLYSNTANVNDFGVCTQGNLIKSVRTATNFNMEFTNYYVGVTSTAAARTVNLPDGNGSIIPQKDQVFIIKDESGAAGLNNITVTTQGGTVTIDGLTSQIINTNYGCITVIFDGTNYFII